MLGAPKLGLPGRAYLLFGVDLEEFSDLGWASANGWRNSPNLLWPEDRAWFVASEIDFDSTLVGGSQELIDDLLDTAGLEVAELAPDASLQWHADTVNGPPSRP